MIYGHSDDLEGQQKPWETDRAEDEEDDDDDDDADFDAGEEDVRIYF